MDSFKYPEPISGPYYGKPKPNHSLGSRIKKKIFGIGPDEIPLDHPSNFSSNGNPQPFRSNGNHQPAPSYGTTQSFWKTPKFFNVFSKKKPGKVQKSSTSRKENPLLQVKEGSLFKSRELPVSSSDYTTVLKAFYNNEKPSANFKVEVHQIAHVNHEKRLQLRQTTITDQGKSNMLIFHGTSEQNVPGILFDGFHASKQGDSVGDYGPGVYTTNFGVYAEQYSYSKEKQYIFVGEVLNGEDMTVRDLNDMRLHKLNKSGMANFRGFEKIIGHNTTGYKPRILKASCRRYFELTRPNKNPFHVKPNHYGLAQPEYDEFRVGQGQIVPAFLIVKTRL